MSFRLRAPRKGITGYWSAIITTPSGERFERTTRCDRKTEARAVAERWDRDAAHSRNQVTLDACMRALRQHKIDQQCSASTLEILELKGGHLLGFFGPERPVDTIRLEDAVAYVRHRRAGTATRHGVGDSTIELELKELRAGLRWLRRCDLYDHDPAALWPGDLLQAPEKRRRWLPIAEFKVLWLALGGTRGYFREQPHGTGKRGGSERRRQWIAHDEAMGADWRDHLTLYCFAGLRLSELYRIEALHIEGDHLRVPGTKTEGAARRLPLGPEALEVLTRRAIEHTAGPLFPLTSPSLDAQERAWLRALRGACARAGIQHASTNDLRRTFCSWCWQGGVAESLLIRWLGHSSTRMVREVYAQSSDEHGRAEIGKLPSAGNLPRILHNHGAIGATRGNSTQRKRK